MEQAHIIIFGTGNYYQKYKSFALKKDSVVALIDNNPAKQGKIIDNLQVIPPEDIHKFIYDYIVLFAAYSIAIEMKTQLVSLGIKDSKILFYDEYIAQSYRGKQIQYCSKGRDIAIISQELNYSGSSLAIIHASIALRNAGHYITLFSPMCDKKIVKDFNNKGINIVECPSLLNMDNTEIHLLGKYDFVIVNVLTMIDAVFKLCHFNKLLWWIHEASDEYSTVYKNIFSRYPQYFDDKRIQNIPVFCVSKVAKIAFNKYFPNCNVGILPCCVQDEAIMAINKRDTKREIITFALIGEFCDLKQQQTFLSAAIAISNEYPLRVKFLLIGKAGNNDYANHVCLLANTMSNVKMSGVLTHKQMEKLYQEEIDVVVCPSLEETLSLTIIEGMMHSKICIASDKTGIADYITDGKNGFICQAGNVNSLIDKMKYCVKHFNELSLLCCAARKTYEKNFTLQLFSKRINHIIKNICN